MEVILKKNTTSILIFDAKHFISNLFILHIVNPKCKLKIILNVLTQIRVN